MQLSLVRDLVAQSGTQIKIIFHICLVSYMIVTKSGKILVLNYGCLAGAVRVLASLRMSTPSALACSTRFTRSFFRLDALARSCSTSSLLRSSSKLEIASCNAYYFVQSQMEHVLKHLGDERTISTSSWHLNFSMLDSSVMRVHFSRNCTFSFSNRSTRSTNSCVRLMYVCSVECSVWQINKHVESRFAFHKASWSVG